jgi:hypothetical protein
VNRKDPSAAALDDFQRRSTPWKSSELVVRSRKLAHLEVAGATYFITFAVMRNSSFLPEHVIW